jgi:hypothetical protein
MGGRGRGTGQIMQKKLKRRGMRKGGSVEEKERGDAEGGEEEWRREEWKRW